MYNRRGHEEYTFTPRETFTGSTNFKWDEKNIMLTPREIFTEGTNFEKEKRNIMFTPREILTGYKFWQRWEIYYVYSL